MCEHTSLPQSCFSLVCCSDLAFLWLPCVLVQCSASAACVMGNRDGVPMSECATRICPTFLPLGNTNSVQIVDMAVQDANPQLKNICDFPVPVLLEEAIKFLQLFWCTHNNLMHFSMQHLPNDVTLTLLGVTYWGLELAFLVLSLSVCQSCLVSDSF